MNIWQAMFSPDALYSLGTGTLISLGLAIGALVIGLVLGILGAMGRISRHGFFRGVAAVYVEVVRGTPMLLQILMLFVGIPMVFRAITGKALIIDPLVAGLIAMGINSGAYTTELIRSGIQGVDRGQMEAARSLGLSYGQAMRHVVLPQAFRRIVPPLVSEFIVLIKDSSLVNSIGAMELMGRSRALGVQYYNLLPFLIECSVVYLLLTLSVSALARKLERRLAISD